MASHRCLRVHFRDGRDDGDGISDTAPAVYNIVATDTIVTHIEFDPYCSSVMIPCVPIYDGVIITKLLGVYIQFPCKRVY